MEYAVLEHGTSRTGRWLRPRRARVALWAAVVEGVLVVFGQIPISVALVGAALVLAFYVCVGRSLRSDAARQLSWIAALSQAFVALVPVVVLLVGTLALILVATLAVVAVVTLVADRR